MAELGAEPADADLVERVLEGDADRFADLVRRHELAVYRVAAGVLRDAAGTENLVQQTFINAFEHLASFDRTREFGAWLRAIARNLAFEELRRSSTEAKYLGRYRDYLLAFTTDSRGLEERERRVDRALEDCRRRLAPAAAEALAMHYDQAKDVDTIARALGRSVGATQQLLYRARAAVRRCLEGRLQPE
jgi:RNA polymerase sigma-70 factor (ECF subfamily)